MHKQTTGLLLVLATALISGVSIFINKFAITDFNPFQFTFLKNTAVALALFGVLLLFLKRDAFSKLTTHHWSQLVAIGATGGSIAFLLYFYALKVTSSAINAGFLHKTLFLFASVLGFFYLKEKFDSKFLIGAGLLLLGNLLVYSALGGFSSTDFLILAAVAIWAIENAYAKKVLLELSGLQVAFGRMFFGAVFILAFLLFTGQFPNLGAVTAPQWFWVGITSLFLLAYVTTFYSGLKHIQVSHATAILMLGQPVTALLTVLSGGKAPAPLEALGLLALVVGSIVIAHSALTARHTAPVRSLASL